MFDLYDININFKTQGEVISKKDLVFDLFFININILREAGQFDLAPDQYSLHSRPASQTGSYRYLTYYRYLLLITGTYYSLLAKKNLH